MRISRPLGCGAVAAVICVAVAAVRVGTSGAFGALVGAVLVTFAGSFTVWLERSTRRLRPEAVMTVALSAFAAKLMVLGVALVLLWDSPGLDALSLGLTAGVVNLAWVAGTAWEALRLRTPVYDAR